MQRENLRGLFVRGAGGMLLAALAACGGGGGGAGSGGGVVFPVPTQPLAAYVLHGEGGIGSANVNVGANGVFTVEMDTYTLLNTGASGCTLTANPPDTDTCNRIADGKGYLFCDDTSTNTFNVAMLQQASFEAGGLADVAGQTLTGLACGPTGPRANTNTFVFNADASLATEKIGGSSFTSSSTAAAVTPGGFVGTPGYQQRWAIYKVAAGGGTQVYLFNLYEALAASSPDIAPKVYFLQK
jgi:hypothetical protein